MDTVTFARHVEVNAVLGDARFVVPEAPPAVRGVGWLRAHVSRFSTGDTHARRRALAIASLGKVDPAALGRRARALARTLPAVLVPVTVLAEAVGVAGPAAEQAAGRVATLAGEYFHAPDHGPVSDGEVPGDSAADDAVTALVTILGGHFDEATAARIGLLVQAHDATNGLVANALAALLHHQPNATTEAVLIETLRHDPPVRLLRRVAAVSGAGLPRGTRVVLDIAAANRDPDIFTDPDSFKPHRARADRHLTLGAGIRPCPGGDHALAIAAGMTEANRATDEAADVR